MLYIFLSFFYYENLPMHLRNWIGQSNVIHALTEIIWFSFTGIRFYREVLRITRINRKGNC